VTRSIGGLGLLVLVVACGPLAWWELPRTYSDSTAQLVASEEISDDFLMRNRLRFRLRDQVRSFDLVVQVHCGEVVVIGLTPLGTRLFAIRQQGRRIQVEDEPEGGWRLAPEEILLDVHRILLYPLADPPLPDGVHAASIGEPAIQERWRGGRLMTRTIADVSGRRSAIAVVRYDGGVTALEPPKRATLDNLERDYTLEVETLSRQTLECKR